MTIHEAKKRFQNRYRFEEGFVGVGICRDGREDALRVYVVDSHFPLARKLDHSTFEGFPVIVEVSGKVQTFS